MPQKRSFVERYVAKKIKDRHAKNVDENLHLLTDVELKEIKRVKVTSLFLSGLTGALAVLVLYLPLYIFPSWFPDSKVWIPGMNEYYDLPVIFTVYSLILLVIEIAVLTLINAWVVKEIAHACNYPNPEDHHYESDINALIAIGLDRKIKDQEQLGINPYVGLAKWQLMMYTAFNLMKAALTNFVFKLLVKRVLGRFALRIVMDLAGIPVYAFWNAWATNKVVRESKVRVMASPIIKKTVKDLKGSLEGKEDFRRDLYNMLDFIAISKRAFHYNHYLFSLLLLEEFGVEINPQREYDPKFFERISKSNKEVKEGFEKVVALGMIIDGRLSKRERDVVEKLNNSKLIDVTVDELNTMANNFNTGKGI